MKPQTVSKSQQNGLQERTALQSARGAVDPDDNGNANDNANADDIGVASDSEVSNGSCLG